MRKQSTIAAGITAALISLATSTAAVSGDGYGVPNAAAPIWTGFYLGAHGGYHVAKASTGGGSIDLDGALGGGHFGYLFRSGPAILGIEGDISVGRAAYSTSIGAARVSASVDQLASLRGRLGLAHDLVLIYVTAGVAHVSGEVSATLGALSAREEISGTGYVVGGGIEAWLSDRISGRIEALRYGFTDLKLAGTTYDIELNSTVIRGGITVHMK